MTTLEVYLQQVVGAVDDVCQSCHKTIEEIRDKSTATVAFFELTRRSDGSRVWRRCEDCVNKEDWV